MGAVMRAMRTLGMPRDSQPVRRIAGKLILRMSSRGVS